MSQTATLSGGFESPSHQSAVAFRSIMTAMARPGRIEQVAVVMPPAPLSQAAAVVLLTLCDPETSIHLAGNRDCTDVRDWVAFHIGAPLVGPDACAFALGRWEALVPLERYPLGSDEYPDRSATVIVETDRLVNDGHVLRGPGIAEDHDMRLSLPDLAAFQANRLRFPRGLDFIFTCGATVAALPRSTKVC